MSSHSLLQSLFLSLTWHKASFRGGGNHLWGVGIRACWNKSWKMQALFTKWGRTQVTELPTCHFLAGGVGGMGRGRIPSYSFLVSVLLSVKQTNQQNKTLSQTAVRQIKMYIKQLANSNISINITENPIILLTRQPLQGWGWMTRKQGLQRKGGPASQQRWFFLPWSSALPNSLRWI